jgi:hypothetical protein
MSADEQNTIQRLESELRGEKAITAAYAKREALQRKAVKEALEKMAEAQQALQKLLDSLSAENPSGMAGPTWKSHAVAEAALREIQRLNPSAEPGAS